MALTLHYFDFDGGRGEPARIAMHLCNIAFEDHRFPVANWTGVRDQMPFRAVPVLDVDSTPLTQSNTILRYIGRVGGLYPEDVWQAAACDETMDAVEDIGTKVVATFFIEDEEAKREARERLVRGPLKLFLGGIAHLLERGGGEYFADSRLTVADLKVYVWVRQLRSGILDHVPTDLPDRVAPILVEHFERIDGHPLIRQYYEGRRDNR